MAATLSHFTSKPEKIRQDQADRLRDVLQEIEAELPIDMMRDLFGFIERRTASRSRWTFVMLSPSQNNTVVQYLASTSCRPLVALKLWALCFEHLRTDTGEILLTRDQIAETLDQSPQNISRIMTELETCGAIIRRREKVNGMRGPGLVRYFMNPRVATNLSGAERDNAQDGAPPILTLMQGGKSAHTQAP